MHAWNPNLRSKTAIRTSDTRYYVDPSIATAALRLGPQDLINDLNTMGLFFETLCVRDLRVYADDVKKACDLLMKQGLLNDDIAVNGTTYTLSDVFLSHWMERL
jgi:hypothetical protein